MLRVAQKKKIHVGPQDNGQRMSLDDFDHAVAQEGYVYELGKGVIEVSEVPNRRHLLQVHELRRQLTSYDLAHPSTIDTIAGATDAKLLIGPSESERHPDIVVYLDPPLDEEDVWSKWVPEIVIEVVSPRSAKRDYEEKPDEYLEFGVDLYLVVDSYKQQMKVHDRWRGQWKTRVVRPGQKFSTPLLPGFSLDLKKVFAAAARAK